MLEKLIVCFLAGLGAGLGTGFAGMSAAAVISPMLITFLGIEAYEAVGIALASDVLASSAILRIVMPCAFLASAMTCPICSLFIVKLNFSCTEINATTLTILECAEMFLQSINLVL